MCAINQSVILFYLFIYSFDFVRKTYNLSWQPREKEFLAHKIEITNKLEINKCKQKITSFIKLRYKKRSMHTYKNRTYID